MAAKATWRPNPLELGGLKRPPKPAMAAGPIICIMRPRSNFVTVALSGFRGHWCGNRLFRRA
jgi:hypothetical protein